jgi:hypothetical protein
MLLWVAGKLISVFNINGCNWKEKNVGITEIFSFLIFLSYLLICFSSQTHKDLINGLRKLTNNTVSQ